MSPADNLSNRNLVSGFSSAVLRNLGSLALLYMDGMSWQQILWTALTTTCRQKKHAAVKQGHQPSLSINVWCGVVHDFLIGSLGTFCTLARTCLQGLFGAHAAIHAGMCDNRCSPKDVLHSRQGSRHFNMDAQDYLNTFPWTKDWAWWSFLPDCSPNPTFWFGGHPMFYLRGSNIPHIFKPVSLWVVYCRQWSWLWTVVVVAAVLTL